MPVEPLAGLFKHRFEIDVPGGEAERCARQLAQRGLVCVRQRRYVRCLDPLDRDRPVGVERLCSGRIYLSRNDGDRDEDDGHYQCPSCGRIVRPSLKREHRSLRLSPEFDAMGAFVAAQLGRIHARVDERPRGLYRVPIGRGELQVCLVDACMDPAVLAPSYPYRRTLIFVVGNARDFMRRIPPYSTVYRLVDLVLGDASSSFQRTVRQLARDAQADSLSMPAVLDVGGSMARSLAAPSGSIASVTHPDGVLAPEGTRWSEVTLYLVDGETIAIELPGQRLRRYRHHELGMVDRRSGRPTRKWRILEKLCEHFGECPWDGTPSEFNAFKAQVSGLRQLLQVQLGIPADPFTECSRAHGLRAAFRAFPDLPRSSPLADTSEPALAGPTG